MSDPPVKRYRRDPSPRSDDESGEDEGYVPYASVAERRRQQLIKLGRAPEAEPRSRSAIRLSDQSEPSIILTDQPQGGQAEGRC